MDTKLKKSRRLRFILGVVVVLLAAVISLWFFPKIAISAERWLEQNGDTQEEYRLAVYSEILEPIYHGSFILALENNNIYDDLNNQTLMELWNNEFDQIRDRVDYYVTNGDGSRTSSNNSNNLGGVLLTEEVTLQQLGQISNLYSACFCLRFDEEGILTVESIYEEAEGDWILKLLQGLDRDAQNLTQDVYDEQTMDWRAERVERPKDITIVWGIPQEYLNTFSAEAEYLGYWEQISAYRYQGSDLLYYGTLAILLLLALVLTAKHLWKDGISYHRIGFCYGAEAAVIAVIVILCNNWNFATWIHYCVHAFGDGIFSPLGMMGSGVPHQILEAWGLAGIIACVYGIWYLALLLLRPVFSLGLRQYVQEYSLIYLLLYRFGGWLQRKWRKLQNEIRHIDFDSKGMRTIRNVVILNFVVLAVISCLWIIGIPVLIIYSGVLFFLLRRQYDLARADYGRLLAAALRMAEGDLNAIEKSEEWGMFEPIKNELEKIRSGFSKAVDEEVRSQRMKTELITNVSHDLKTPLTAITTYVELLKNPDITPEERASYIDTLERKALRLKVLIEDLFEVSKASSNNIKLELQEVDVVNLLKQVSVEHTDKFEAKGLELRWQMPEKAVCTLDSQKTYRIFENLFVNIEKYAMENSRVYVEVHQKPEEDASGSQSQGEMVSGGPAAGEAASCSQSEGGGGLRRKGKTRIVLKNMSAAELNVRPEELTERFVRGDDSRNTEGSGLGLAIVRSFTEAQGGSFGVEIDGDLFKAVIEI